MRTAAAACQYRDNAGGGRIAAGVALHADASRGFHGMQNGGKRQQQPAEYSPQFHSSAASRPVQRGLAARPTVTVTASHRVTIEQLLSCWPVRCRVRQPASVTGRPGAAGQTASRSASARSRSRADHAAPSRRRRRRVVRRRPRARRMPPHPPGDRRSVRAERPLDRLGVRRPESADHDDPRGRSRARGSAGRARSTAGRRPSRRRRGARRR